MGVVVVVVHNSNSVVVIHFLMLTNKRKLPKKRIKPLLPSRLLTLGALQLVPTAKWYLNFFWMWTKKKVLGNGFHGWGGGSVFFFLNFKFKSSMRMI
jgi:hypothetical protein